MGGAAECLRVASRTTELIKDAPSAIHTPRTGEHASGGADVRRLEARPPHPREHASAGSIERPAKHPAMRIERPTLPHLAEGSGRSRVVCIEQPAGSPVSSASHASSACVRVRVSRSADERVPCGDRGMAG
ncbi:hypothetical protein Afil01_41480 [Actinorhabdospora filicis]|uniref:Uncharacterized protein n=1 Tax=Actinorhabdospora filicis TaxID=1785913 RepID=A0A9W6WB96_9ACTN|nr:hypothetical protein Afil01_41480 [Actinorhabdospora filicis]